MPELHMETAPVLEMLALRRHRSVPADTKYKEYEFAASGTPPAKWSCTLMVNASENLKANIRQAATPANCALPPCHDENASSRMPAAADAHQVKLGEKQQAIRDYVLTLTQTLVYKLQLISTVKLQRSVRRFLFMSRRSKAALAIQRSLRSYMHQLRASEAGRCHLANRREKSKTKAETKVASFIKSRKRSRVERMLLQLLTKISDGRTTKEEAPDKILDRVLRLDHRKNCLMGLQPVKDFLAGLRQDILSSYALGEELHLDPVLFCGPPGSGKRLSAELIFEEIAALGACKGPFREVHTWDDLLLAFDEAKEGVISNCIYITDMEHDIKWDEVLKKIQRSLPRAAVLFGLNSLPIMRTIHAFFLRVEPVRLEFPPLTVQQLAEIARQKLEELGYQFSAGLDVAMLEKVITDQWSTSMVAARNGHLANIMIRRAIHNKHQRQQLGFGFVKNPTVLTPADFGVTESNTLELIRAQESVLQELDALPGFDKAKEFLHNVQKRVQYTKNHGAPQFLETSMNLILTGNPGSGKTTFARLLFKLLHAYGILKKNTFVEMNVLELKGEYLGGTAPKVIEAVRSALGGCLFLDEAYALVDREVGKDQFSSEAIAALLTEVENHRSDLLVVLAGYREPMSQLLAQDPGLARRFPLRMDLPDYTVSELVAIAEKVARDRFSLSFQAELAPQLARLIEEKHSRDIGQQNASLAVALVERAVEMLTCRFVDSCAICDCKELIPADFGISATVENEEEAARQRIEAELQSLVGMAEPKEYLQKLMKRAEFVRRGGNPAVLQVCMNLVLTGNPGTGKTTFARLLFRILRTHGVLKKDLFVERNALQLKGQYCGQTAPKISELFKMAKGGCLFLDEAYALANGDSFSNEAIRMLLTEVENNRTDVLVILAGYQDKMEELMRADPGLARRFPRSINLPNYSAVELAAIARTVAVERFRAQLETGVEASLAAWLDPRLQTLDADRYNGGLAVQLVEEAMGRAAERMVTEELTGPDLGELQLAAEDFGITV